MVKVYEDTGGWRIDVFVEGKKQRTAWVTTKQQAEMVSREFAAYYSDRYEMPLPIEKPF